MESSMEVWCTFSCNYEYPLSFLLWAKMYWFLWYRLDTDDRRMYTWPLIACHPKAFFLNAPRTLILFSIYTLSDLGVLSNLIGSLSLANEHYSPPTEWIMRKPSKNKMAGVNSRFASVSESIFNGFLLKMLFRSLSVYILKQLFFSISVNSVRIFTSLSKNNC